MNKDFDYIRNQTIGTVEYVSPNEIKVLLEINAPQSTAINTGVPQLFPKVNGFVLVPNESGALVGIISWIGIEHSPYPKRKGYKDFDLIDLPFPLRKLSISPLGVLQEKEGEFNIERGVYSYPSVGDIVTVPTQDQLRAIVQNKDELAKVKIGTSPMAANAPVYVNPDRVFGRHIAILGNTGSGKSCSVSGLIRWSLESAIKEKKKETINSRFIILDPNGEYSKAFDDICEVKKFQVHINPDQVSDAVRQLKVPSWMWNSYEWSSIAQASGKTQRPLLRQALREIRYGGQVDENDLLIKPKRFIISILVSLRNFQRSGISGIAEFPGKQNLGESLNSAKESLTLLSQALSCEPKNSIETIIDSISLVLSRRSPNQNGYYPAFTLQDLTEVMQVIESTQEVFGELVSYQGPDEDSPVYFSNKDFLIHIERLAADNNAQQFMDFFMMRMRSILTDVRIASVIDTESRDEINLSDWLESYIGSNNDDGSIKIIDLSLLPSEILFVIVSVLSRIIFEAHQRYRRSNNQILPTTLVVEEAHNFIKRYNMDSEEITSAKLCSQQFEKIAKEGRKFGLGLMISSQRPSELSQTVLSQCNTFLLHRLVNDKDQEMVKKLVPDNLGSVLDELPILPTQKAILLGWAAPIPVIVEMNTLKKEHRPESKDPDFWNVWIGEDERNINWDEITNEWQNEENI